LQEGRTPLHYAAALQGTTNGLNQLYSVLVESGADENVVDVVSFDITDQELAPWQDWLNTIFSKVTLRPFTGIIHKTSGIGRSRVESHRLYKRG